ncbi:MAG: hypothetical protein WD379_01170 [Dehalococcoidia bacterium]
MPKKSRTLPRPFALHWGSGQIVEEARYAGEHHEPALQLLAFDDGSLSIRFCYYDHAGRFQRSPLIVSSDEMKGLKGALAGSPRLRALMKEMLI